MVTVRTFDFGVDRAMADIHRGLESSKLGLRGIRSSLRQTHQFETQICALLRAAAHGPLRVMFPMVTNLEDWDEAMRLVAHCRQLLADAQPADGQRLKIALITGAEGGFAVEEAEMAANAGVKTVGLGPRILRCETAPLAVLSAVMTLTGNLE